MQASETRPVDRYLERVMQEMRDIVALSQAGDEDVPSELLERLDITSAEYPYDTAQESADAMVYAIQRLALVDDAEDGGLKAVELREVELLLGGGGPTITFTAKLRDGDEVRDAILWHSWGDSVGNEASARVDNQADLETVDAFLQLLGVYGY